MSRLSTVKHGILCKRFVTENADPIRWARWTCGTYHGHKTDCTPHTIKVMALHQIVLGEIQRVTQEAKQHREEFLQRAMDKHQSQLKQELSAKERELAK